MLPTLSKPAGTSYKSSGGKHAFFYNLKAHFNIKALTLNPFPDIYFSSRTAVKQPFAKNPQNIQKSL